MKKIRWLAFCCVGSLVRWADVAYAQEVAPAKKWKNATEASFVTTNGNSKATTTSAKNTFGYAWSRLTTLELIAQALGSSSGRDVTAENYNASEKVSWQLSERNYTYEKFKWEKDRFAQIGNRYDGSVGFGRLLLDWPKDKLIGELGGGYVNEELTQSPRNDYASGRAYSKYEHTFQEKTKFSQDGEYLHNFSDSDAYRLNTETALITALNSSLSFKASFQWKRNAKPPPGAVRDDTLTSMALVVNY